MSALLLLFLFSLQGGQSAIVCTVTAGGAPVAGAEIVVAGKTYVTDPRGEVRIDVDPGSVELTVVKEGFAPVTTTVTVEAGQQQPVTIELEKLPSVQETVTVSATRTERGLEDQPMRVEVLDAEEIDEKLMMTPGDVVMMLNEMGGMRVQATSPSLGAASVRIQGMRGRYTRFLSDGLPLFGEQVSLGLMQIPPLDLGRVEVIKGVASSLYGAGAMSGVVNLVSRRPGAKPERQLLLNRSSRGATDAGFWYSTPLSDHWGMTLLASANGQERTDVDDDDVGGPAEVRASRRASAPVLGQPCGPDVLRDGRRHVGRPHRRLDARRRRCRRPAVRTSKRSIRGAPTSARRSRPLSANGVMWSARGSWTSQRQDHRLRRDHRARRPRHRLCRGDGPAGDRPAHAGGRRRRSNAIDFQPIDLPRFAYTFTVPGVFVQDDVDVATLAGDIGERPARSAQRVRHVRQPAHLRARPPRAAGRAACRTARGSSRRRRSPRRPRRPGCRG